MGEYGGGVWRCEEVSPHTSALHYGHRRTDPPHSWPVCALHTIVLYSNTLRDGWFLSDNQLRIFHQVSLALLLLIDSCRILCGSL